MVDLVTAIICFALGSLLTLNAYAKGLRHNYELKNNIAPKEEKNVVAQFIEHKQEVKQVKEQADIMNEWVNGAE